MTTNPQDLDALVALLESFVPGCNNDTAELLTSAAEAITALRRDVLAAGAAATEQAADWIEAVPQSLPNRWDYAQHIRALTSPEATSALDAVKRAEYVRGLLDHLAAAYQQGALDVHYNWQPDKSPDFSEAADDYAKSILAMIPEDE